MCICVCVLCAAGVCAQPHRVAMFTLPIACVLPLELRKDALLYQQGDYPYYSPYQLVRHHASRSVGHAARHHPTSIQPLTPRCCSVCGAAVQRYGAFRNSRHVRPRVSPILAAISLGRSCRHDLTHTPVRGSPCGMAAGSPRAWPCRSSPTCTRVPSHGAAAVDLLLPRASGDPAADHIPSSGPAPPHHQRSVFHRGGRGDGGRSCDDERRPVKQWRPAERAPTSR